MSHTPTRSAVQEQAAQLLEIKNALRDKKRKHLEELFEQQQRIRQEMHELQSELHALDDEIDNLEQQSLITDGVLTQKTPPAPSTQWNAQEMFLTDPITQTVAKKCPPNVSESTIQEDYNVEDESPILDSTKPTVLQLGQPSLVVKQLKKPISRRGENLESYFNQATTFNKPQVPKSYPWTERVLYLLRNTFKITSFREHQRDIIDATLSGKDCFVIMRTGGGKSLTYQLPALYEGRYAPEEITPKITIVISPLVSLIHDQEEQMNEFCPGSAISFTSNLKGGVSEHARRWELVRTPGSGVCLVFVTPEKVAKSGKVKAELEKLFKAQRLGRIVIDECHCCSQWGHDFRPDYTKLGMLKSHFPNVPLLAVTATASDQVRDDCCQLLQIRSDHAVFKSTANRPNLIYEVRIKSDKKNSVVEDMANFIKQKHPNSAGIVYTLSKKEAAETAKNLTSLGIKAEAYHADISPATKERVHRRWMKNEIQCVTATIAFGLGINKPDVRFVLHHSISKTLENYYQESGRAGRDGLSADCILYYAPKDVTRMRCMIDTDSRGTLDSFWQMVRYANDFGTDARCRTILLRALGEVNTVGLPPRPHDDQGQEKDVTEHAKMAIRLIQWSLDKGDKLTVKQLVDLWKSKSPPEWVKEAPPTGWTKDECERIVVTMMTYDIVLANVEWNAYGSTLYLNIGQKAIQFLSSPTAKFALYFPFRPPSKTGTRSTPNDKGWLSTKKRSRSVTKEKPKSTTTRPRKSTGSKPDNNTVIELASDEDTPSLKRPKSLRESVQSWSVDLMNDSQSEGEFDAGFQL